MATATSESSSLSGQLSLESVLSAIASPTGCDDWLTRLGALRAASLHGFGPLPPSDIFPGIDTTSTVTEAFDGTKRLRGDRPTHLVLAAQAALHGHPAIGEVMDGPTFLSLARAAFEMLGAQAQQPGHASVSDSHPYCTSGVADASHDICIRDACMDEPAVKLSVSASDTHTRDVAVPLEVPLEGPSAACHDVQALDDFILQLSHTLDEDSSTVSEHNMSPLDSVMATDGLRREVLEMRLRARMLALVRSARSHDGAADQALSLQPVPLVPPLVASDIDTIPSSSDYAVALSMHTAAASASATASAAYDMGADGASFLQDTCLSIRTARLHGGALHPQPQTHAQALAPPALPTTLPCCRVHGIQHAGVYDIGMDKDVEDNTSHDGSDMWWEASPVSEDRMAQYKMASSCPHAPHVGDSVMSRDRAHYISPGTPKQTLADLVSPSTPDSYTYAAHPDAAAQGSTLWFADLSLPMERTCSRASVNPLFDAPAAREQQHFLDSTQGPCRPSRLSASSTSAQSITSASATEQWQPRPRQLLQCRLHSAFSLSSPTVAGRHDPWVGSCVSSCSWASGDDAGTPTSIELSVMSARSALSNLTDRSDVWVNPCFEVEDQTAFHAGTVPDTDIANDVTSDRMQSQYAFGHCTEEQALAGGSLGGRHQQHAVLHPAAADETLVCRDVSRYGSWPSCGHVSNDFFVVVRMVVSDMDALSACLRMQLQ